jgi:hypothetical protein
MLLKDSGLCMLEDAVEPAKNDEREDYIGILEPLVITAQDFGNTPDEVNLRLEVVHCLSPNEQIFPVRIGPKG